MPRKYVIHTKEVPNRFKAISRSGVIAWEEGCLKCAVCVKTQCVYHVYEHRSLDPRQMIDSIDNECMNCLRCVQSCPKQLIHKAINPEYKSLGDDYWTPDIISRLWYQAETGKIPVSGAGYPGPFSGPNFDSMWTDMSEIVRPTRDGIHGREYISTAVDLGTKKDHLDFKGMELVEESAPAVVAAPLPILLRVPAFGAFEQETIKGWARAASRLGTFLALPAEMNPGEAEAPQSCLIPIVSLPQAQSGQGNGHSLLVEIPWSEHWRKAFERMSKSHPGALICVRVPFLKGAEERVLSVAKNGASIIHLEADFHGRSQQDETLLVRDGIRSAHLALVQEGIRDEVTLLASGGIAMAEHVAKAIICGADAVFIDFPILIALECRMCLRCKEGLSCPVEINTSPASWVASRVVNLVGAFHNQLLEVMGAMGIRDARRLRGEVGRSMFFDELDEAAFGQMGYLKEGYELE